MTVAEDNAALVGKLNTIADGLEYAFGPNVAYEVQLIRDAARTIQELHDAAYGGR